MGDIKDRKKDHVALTVTESTQYRVTTGFERFRFNHNALPEVNLGDVSTEADLLGRTFALPLFISSMTGGYAEAGAVNAIIAEFCELNNLPFGVGSQRAMLEDDSLTNTFSIVRQKAPTAFICSNIGGAQLIGEFPKSKISTLIDSIEADAVIVHLNPLQELMQPEGDQNFKGILTGIEGLVKQADVPVIVKETGAGISKYVAKRLLNAGVSVIDVSGAGGTSWAKVENQRASHPKPNAEFDEWGIPTAVCLQQISTLQWERDFELVASGGIRTASDIAKSICLGATFSATAQPIIKAVVKNGYQGLEEYIQSITENLGIILTLLGCNSIRELNQSHLLEN
ncbi:MAG: type 2 isopentenyl-diphosphate Delta-isomerase [Balneolales bacterium]|nr:type 2 isopentenyl-diphosphate Delta-isomerase [Balneolales bacterium]